MDDADRECLAIAARELGTTVDKLPTELRAALVRADERVCRCSRFWERDDAHLHSRQVIAAIIAAWEFSQEVKK